MRILGYDTIYWRGNDPQVLMEKGRGRILLTRNTKFPHGGSFQGIIVVREDNPDLQLRIVMRKLSLKVDEQRIFSRCLICNQELKKVPKHELEVRIPEFVFSTYSEFRSCPECSRIYWKGSHQDNIRKKIAELSSH